MYILFGVTIKVFKKQYRIAAEFGKSSNVLFVCLPDWFCPQHSAKRSLFNFNFNLERYNIVLKTAMHCGLISMISQGVTHRRVSWGY